MAWKRRSGKSVVIPRQSGSHMSLAGFAVLLPDALGPTFSRMPEACLLPGQTEAGDARPGCLWSRALAASQLGIFSNACKCTALMFCLLSFS